MKRLVAALVVACVGTPVFAQASGATQIEVEGQALINSWIALFNKGDAAGLAKDVYAGMDQALLDAQVQGASRRQLRQARCLFRRFLRVRCGPRQGAC